MKTAEKVGEDLYSFKPTPDVRSLGGVLGHIADGNKLLCPSQQASRSTSRKMMKDLSAVQVHEKKTKKAEIIAALNETKAFCESVFAKIDDTSGQEAVMVRRPEDAEGHGSHASQQPRVGTLRESGDLHAAEGDRSAFERAAADAVGSL